MKEFLWNWLKFSLTLFWQKYRESNIFTNDMIWRNILENSKFSIFSHSAVRVNFCNFHTVQHLLIIFHRHLMRLEKDYCCMSFAKVMNMNNSSFDKDFISAAVMITYYTLNSNWYWSGIISGHHYKNAVLFRHQI